MSQEQLQTFLAQAKGDTELQSQLRKAINIQSVEAIAKTAGLRLAPGSCTARQSDALTDDELEGASAAQFGSYCQCHQTICKNYTIN